MPEAANPAHLIAKLVAVAHLAAPVTVGIILNQVPAAPMTVQLALLQAS